MPTGFGGGWVVGCEGCSGCEATATEQVVPVLVSVAGEDAAKRGRMPAVPLRNLTILFMTAVISLMCYGEAERNRYAHILSDSIVKISDNYVEPVDRRVLFEGGLEHRL